MAALTSLSFSMFTVYTWRERESKVRKGNKEEGEEGSGGLTEGDGVRLYTQ